MNKRNINLHAPMNKGNVKLICTKLNEANMIKQLALLPYYQQMAPFYVYETD